MSKISAYTICSECGNHYEKTKCYKCDVCGKEGFEVDFPIKLTKHTDYWGNDSCDSYNYFHFCNANCLSKFTLGYLNKKWVFELTFMGDIFASIIR